MTTPGPPIWVHLYVMGSPSGSELPDPSSSTCVLGPTRRLGPGFATGFAFTPGADTLTIAGRPTRRPSSTKRLKASVVSVRIRGNVTEGESLVASSKGAAGRDNGT